MSISIKNISVSIAGVKSEEFNIELEGVIYNLDSFCLAQNLLSPNHLSFIIRKGPEEGIDETLFSVCGYIIGKEIEVSLQTEIVTPDTPGDKAADITFNGVITSASGCRECSEYYVSVEAVSREALLDGNPDCKSYENMTLNEIVEDVLSDYSDLITADVNARFTEVIPYCVQYNETDYQFLTRLARRYGEWMYNDGIRLVFGVLPESDIIKLTYPGQDIPSYNIELKMKHVPFSHVASSYNAYDATRKEGREEMMREYNTLSESVFNASVECYLNPTVQNVHSGGFADDDGRETVLNISTKTQARGEKAGMLQYSGTTYSSKLKPGSVLVVEDGYISNTDTNEKSQVEQDSMLIIGLTHYFDKDRVYSNTFSGIPSACDYPPYSDTDVYPAAPSCRAKVVDNEDPNNLGRIRVQFDWQAQQDASMITPWLRIAQPYAGGGKGFSFIPEIGEEVIINFEGANAERPYVAGTFFNGPDCPDNSWLPGNNQVKAIRTRNGHTVEIWDKGEGGYIRIYDNGKENYILTFSTDDKLIKLESTGNIELYAQNDIIMHAGHDINASADNDIFIAASNDMQRTADNDIREYAGNDRTTSIDRNDTLMVESNQFITVNENKDEQIAHKLQVTAENIRIEAKQSLLQYSTVHQQKADATIALNAGVQIDINAGKVKVQ